MKTYKLGNHHNYKAQPSNQPHFKTIWEYAHTLVKFLAAMPTKPSQNTCQKCKDWDHTASGDPSTVCLFRHFSKSLYVLLLITTTNQDCKSKPQLKTDFILFPSIKLLIRIHSPSIQFVTDVPLGSTALPVSRRKLGAIKVSPILCFNIYCFTEHTLSASLEGHFVITFCFKEVSMENSDTY